MPGTHQNQPMRSIIAYPLSLDRFQPLERVLVYDEFDNGFNGWMSLMPNFTQAPNFDIRHSIVDKTRFPPVMLSSATFRYPGTHGAMNGTYSLKLATRPVANRYEEVPDPEGLAQAIKRLSFHRSPRGLLQFEMWFAYTVEQDRVSGEEDLAGIGERSVRAFGAGFDLHYDQHRYFIGARYLNSVNGELKKKWQVMKASDVSDVEWTYGSEGEWAKTGVDPMWYGRRYADGTHDGYKDVLGGTQDLCYNETDCKINWLYFRLTVDAHNRRYVEMQAQDQTFDLSGFEFTQIPPYARIDRLLNPLVWVENDTDRRVFLYLDSVVVSTGDS
jgi:hypothetical protein